MSQPLPLTLTDSSESLVIQSFARPIGENLPLAFTTTSMTLNLMIATLQMTVSPGSDRAPSFKYINADFINRTTTSAELLIVPTDTENLAPRDSYYFEIRVLDTGEEQVVGGVNWNALPSPGYVAVIPPTPPIIISWAQIGSTPTTLAGYGITDADPAGSATTAAASRVAKAGDTMTGGLTVGANVLNTDGSVSFAGGNLTSDVSGNATANSLTVESLLSNGNFTCEAFSASSGPELVLVSNCTISDSGNNTLIMPDNVGGMTFPGLVTASGGITGNLTGIGETGVPLGGSLSGTVPVDYADGEIQYGTLAGAVTFTFSSFPASGTGGTLTLRINGDGAHSMTFPGAVNWGATGAPAQPVASGKRIRLYFSTEDAGTTIDAAWGGPF